MAMVTTCELRMPAVLDKAPKYSKGTDWNWNRDNDRCVYDYYKAPPYWGV